MKKLYQDFKKGKSAKFIWIVSFFIEIFIFLLPALLSQPYIWGLSFFDLSKSGEIGSAVGGIITPFIAIFAAIITFYAFWVQFQSNIAQTKQFRKSDDLARVNRFETKFYELLRIQRDNVSEISIIHEENEIVKGRNCFSSFFIEFKFCFLQLKKLNKNHDNILMNWTYHNDHARSSYF